MAYFAIPRKQKRQAPNKQQAPGGPEDEAPEWEAGHSGDKV